MQHTTTRLILLCCLAMDGEPFDVTSRGQLLWSNESVQCDVYLTNCAIARLGGLQNRGKPLLGFVDRVWHKIQGGKVCHALLLLCSGKVCLLVVIPHALLLAALRAEKS